MIEYFQSLGVTALELLPVHQFVVDRHLAERGLTNYWGYNSIGFFAPDVRYATRGLGNQVYEFKTMVKTLHSAGLEVILDVVYNHTGEGNHLGPTLSLQGDRQLGVLPPRAGQPALLHRLHRHGQLAQHAAPAHDPAHDGLAALLGEGDARRRLPLRPRAGAGARAVRRGQAVGVLRHHAAGSRRSPT